MQLFNTKTIDRHVASAPAPDPAKLEVLRQWGETIRDGSIESQKETALHGNFKQRIICEVLGYSDFNDSGEWTVDVEAAIGSGSVDLAFGRFTKNESRIIAPFELKGARTKDLDAIMPGRAKSPVKQAWDYASDNVGTKWVLVSNYLEIRIYSYADGRQFFDSFDLAKLHEPAEYQRFMLLLSAENLLSGRTLAILDESRKEDRDITARLYADYRTLRSDLIGAVNAERPNDDPLESIRLGQTILDRVLFIAFAEDNGLLPDDSLLSAFQHNDPYNPKPVWQTFLGLFNAIDQGNSQLDIPRYNGGLFQPNEAIRALNIPDHICEGFKRLAEYDFASEISVTVLGHIFEQSIADVEQLQAEALSEAPVEKKASGTSGRRKRDGVVYTPDYVARFIVDQTLGAHCREIFAGLLDQYAKKGAKADDDPIAWKSAKAEREAWAAYRDRLTHLRIVDPACGSGVFLIMAFDYMKTELQQVNAKLAELEGKGMAGNLLDPDSEILTNNLFGVDVNSESVEIAKLSLWIKTAKRGKVLDSLDANLRVGDSLIEDSSFAYRSHGFEWKSAFPEIFAEGGFDVVLGNPPYVRMELIKPMKPWLEKRYEVVSDRADLYVYFFERGVKLLKPGGRLGFISSRTFFSSGSGSALRRFLKSSVTIENIVDFGEVQIFEGVTTYPAILTLVATPPQSTHSLEFWNVDSIPEGSFQDFYEDVRKPYRQFDLSEGSWQLEDQVVAALRDKLLGDRKTLEERYGSPMMGVKTGLKAAFVIDTPTKIGICQDDPKSIDLLKPLIEGKGLHRWGASSGDDWLIYTPKNRVNIADYPAIRKWLMPFKERLERRATKQEWFELQQAQEAYVPILESPKIMWSDIASEARCHLDESANFCENTGYFLKSASNALVAYLNSSVAWFIIKALTAKARGGYARFQTQYVEQLPILDDIEVDPILNEYSERCHSAAEKRCELQQSITRRIPDLAAEPGNAELSNKLKQWWELPDFAAFQKEVKKALKATIPLQERNEWENWITKTRAEINAKVYALFDLTPDEIALLEANI
ncbi:Eco57I restriction-modification methylase domain-containing protein [Altererythrobacter lutimaris]|uniref:site-specific DNA-methyltransferase (adenine-specific) n=1 Tax=Altererythrobacter lutimaris TaxID=2743979 RepID=A0A850H6X3_9SPHN|nr:DNA methyltransferase [Altererythrobacter lutimaris]NVE94917.1 Eco57I restriction-modification methylase domain-containing protein [Altererythrobacter lutimaris]